MTTPDTPTDAELLTANKAYGDYCEAEGTIPTYRQIFVAGWGGLLASKAHRKRINHRRTKMPDPPTDAELVERLTTAAAERWALDFCLINGLQAASAIERLTRDRDDWKKRHDDQEEAAADAIETPDNIQHGESVEELVRQFTASKADVERLRAAFHAAQSTVAKLQSAPEKTMIPPTDTELVERLHAIATLKAFDHRFNTETITITGSHNFNLEGHCTQCWARRDDAAMYCPMKIRLPIPKPQEPSK